MRKKIKAFGLQFAEANRRKTTDTPCQPNYDENDGLSYIIASNRTPKMS